MRDLTSGTSLISQKNSHGFRRPTYYYLSNDVCLRFFQSSASECILDSLLAARAQMIQRLKLKYGDDVEETTLLSKMMAYCSKEAHSSVEKVR